MRIAIQVADLDHERIDGTRVYIANVLKFLGKIAPQDEFSLYHKGEFNPALTPPELPNYQIKKCSSLGMWTQTAFMMALHRDRPDVVWMPMHNTPLIHPKNAKIVVTIHDLAFRKFPKTFPMKDLAKLDLLSSMAINQADQIIAVSEATKKDILKYYPQKRDDRIDVVYHGFDPEIFQKEVARDELEKVLAEHQLKNKKYLLYVGAIQPRKNLVTLVRAFDQIADRWPELKLVIAGEKAWKTEEAQKQIDASPNRSRIVTTGRLNFLDLARIYQGALLFVLPSLYEGFGIPILEAMASGVPVIAANNSSLPEVGGTAAQYFTTESVDELAKLLAQLIEDEKKRTEMVRDGLEWARSFSWEQCARKTLEIIHKAGSLG